MKTISFSCPNCGANIDIDLDHIAKYCDQCGSKVMIDVEAFQELLVEKERTKQEAIRSTESTKKQKIESEESIAVERILADKNISIATVESNNDYKSNKLALIVFIVGIGALLLMMIGIHLYSHRDEFHDKSILKDINALCDEIEECIDDEEYDDAESYNRRLRSKIKELQYYGNKEEWETTYEEYCTAIERERRKTERISSSYVNIGMSSSDFEDMSYSQAYDYLINCGFFNISLNKTDVGFFTTRYNVASIIVNGRKNFNSGTNFPDDSKIIITYYE
ncbi:MAG: zinc ribbon domain-containing protein [Clostridiales bacterium]|nr:zinc ribbon domain-containing protein [Clostridiales bacterium]